MHFSAADALSLRKSIDWATPPTSQAIVPARRSESPSLPSQITRCRNSTPTTAPYHMIAPRAVLVSGSVDSSRAFTATT